MVNFKNALALVSARFSSNRGQDLPPVLLDTALGSENSGDWVIMAACQRVCDELFPGFELRHVATHYYSDELESLESDVKLLCGTNILYTHMEGQQQWALPHNISSFKGVCLFGVGMSDIGIDDSIDSYSKLFYRTVLSKTGYHSVRDEMTRQRLLSIGVTNVLNTACPTMWSLTDQAQKLIPAKKGRMALTSITDYAFSPEQDLQLLELLQQEYERVIIWVQGSHDIDWCLDKIVNLNDFQVVGPDIASLDEILKTEELDYVGTRLHAGIRCLNRGHRSLIVAVDNRARQIGADTGLPVVEREAIFSGEMSNWINNPSPSNIILPWDAISKWKSQFSVPSLL